jgi:hypothetical protein
VARVSSLSKCDWTAAVDSWGGVTVVMSGRVILWRVEVALLLGRRPFSFRVGGGKILG